MTEQKNPIKNFNSRLEQAEERIGEILDRSFENIQLEE